MLTTTLVQAYTELENMNKAIEESQAHMRVLDAIGAPEALTVRNKLNSAISERDKVMKAIEAERDHA